jgi:hypothetical protein
MDLAVLVQELTAASPEELLREGKLVQRVRFAPEWKNHHAELSATQWRKTPGPEYDLNISAMAQRELTDARLQQKFSALLDAARDMQMRRKRFAAGLQVRWTPEQFAQEERLGTLDRLTLFAGFREAGSRVCDGQKAVHTEDRRHELRVEVQGTTMTIGATGEYRALLPVIMNKVGIPTAVVRLSFADAEQWLENVGTLQRWRLQHMLIAREYDAQARYRGQAYRRSAQYKEITLPMHMLTECEMAIGKSLCTEDFNEESFVVSAAKTFFLHKQVLPALQGIVRLAADFNAAKEQSARVFPLFELSCRMRVDAVQLKYLVLPPRAQISGLVVRSYSLPSDELAVQYERELLHFRLRVALHSSRLLHLQEAACREFGIMF